jgi:hypothetical protein
MQAGDNPLVAACLKTGLTAHCIDLVLNENGVLEQKIPAYGRYCRRPDDGGHQQRCKITGV